MPIAVKRTDLELAFPRASLHVAALSPNARRAYVAQWRQWLAYAQATDLTPLPAAPTAVAQWLMS